MKNMTLRTSLFAGAFLLAAIGHTATAQRSITLELNMAKGTTYTMSTTIEQDIEQNIMGMSQGVTQEMAFVYHYEVQKKKRNGIHNVDLTYEAIKFSNATPMGSATYDSSDPNSEPNMQTQAYAALVGQQLQLEMTKRGEIQEVSGIESLINHMIDAYGIPEGPQKEEVRTLVNQQFNEESIKNQLASVAITYPEEALKVGDSFDNTGEITAGFAMTINSTYTVESISKDAVVLNVKSTLMTGDNSEPMSMQGMEMIYKLKGTQEGKVTIDPKTGWVVQSNIKLTAEGDVELLPNDQVPQGMEWPIEIKTTTTSTVVE